MYATINTLWVKKIFLYNSRITCVVLQLIQPKLYKHSQIRTHYDTLEVTSGATQDEIKSSYYKLSMLYHPDKNKTELAKRKFQNISEAYEVLSNHQARKRYDRSMMIIQQNVKRHEPKNIYMHPSVYKSKVHPIKSAHFNFDVWVKEHYGQSFVRKQTKYKQFVEDEESQKTEDPQQHFFIFYIATFIISNIIIFVVQYSYDTQKTRKVSGHK